MVLAEHKSAKKDGNAIKETGTALVSVSPEPHNKARPRSKSRRLWLWGVAVLAGIGIAGFIYVQFWMVQAQNVIVEIASLEPVTRVLAVNGRIAALHSVDVRPLVSGTLETLAVGEGDKVASDAILAKINAESQNAVVRQAASGLDAALVAQQKAIEAYDRAVKLGNNIAKSVLETNDHAVQSATQEVVRQTALVDQAKIALQNYTIRAPIAGTVLVINVDEGQLVDPAIKLLTLADLSALVVETDVDEAYARQIAPDQPAVLQLAGETATHPGHVSYVSTQVDVSTGGLAVRITFDEPLNAPVGMTVTTNIIVDQRQAALTLPRTAIFTDDNGSGFFVVKDGTAHLKPVSVVDWPAARLIVTDGLSEGDVVIMDAEGLKDGAPVKIVEP